MPERTRVTQQTQQDAADRDYAADAPDAGAVAVHARIYRDSPALRSYSREMFAGQERALREAIESGADSPGAGSPGADGGLGAGASWPRSSWRPSARSGSPPLLRIAAGAAFEEAAGPRAPRAGRGPRPPLPRPFRP
ncbi:hypothetical protein GCM10018952_35410 [Streptosporangium vulgare]